MARPFPVLAGTTGLRYRRRGRCVCIGNRVSGRRLLSTMSDLEAWHAPAAIAHVACQHTEPLGLDLAGDLAGDVVPATGPDARVRHAVQEGREDEPVAVQVRTYQQH